jgi:hypothetical protein
MKIKTTKCIALTFILSSINFAYASFTYYDPLESNKGGSLPTGSIGFNNGNTGGNTGGGNGTGGGNNGEGSGNEGSGNGGEEQSLASKKCDASAEAAKTFLSSKGDTYSYHYFSLAEGGLPDRCQIIYELPIQKSWECTGDLSYINANLESLKGLGIDIAATIPVGECP